MSTEKNLTNLVINKVESQDVYDYMKANSLINADELYVVAGGDQIATETDDGLMSSEDKIKLDNIEENANNYIHPAYTPRSNGLYKVTIDSTGHVSATTAVTKADITALGIPGEDTNTTYSEATTATSGLMSSSDKTKLDSIPAEKGNYQYLVTDGEGNTMWEDRLGYKAVIKNVVVEKSAAAFQSHMSYKGTYCSERLPFFDSSLSYAIVTVDGVEYELHGSNGIVGNQYLASDSMEDTGEPVCLKMDVDIETSEFGCLIITNLSGSTHDIVISVPEETVVKIPEEYMPYEFVKVEPGKGLSTNDYTTEEKEKLAGVESGANKTTVDSSLSSTSTNPVQNKIINTKFDSIQASIDSKVDKVTGKGLSTNDLTATLKSNYNAAYTHSQQAHAPADAEKNVIVGVQKNGTDLTVNSSTRKVNITVPTKTSELTNDSDFATTTQLDTKVDKVTGKGLSTNDYTTEEKTKLSNIEDGANKTIVDTALSSTSTNPVQNKVINTKLSTMQSDIDSKADDDHTHSELVNGNASVVLNVDTRAYGLSPQYITTFLPESTNVYSYLGTSSNKWDHVYANNINLNGTDLQSTLDSKVPSTRTVNGKALSANITLSASDVGALPNTTQIPSIDGLATETYVDNKVAGLVDSAPAALDTLNELAAALGDDPNFATTVATQIGTKVDKVDGKGLSTNDYTTAEKTKLSGIAEGAEVNQNAFSNVTIGSTTISADSKTDTLTLVAGNNVTITPDSTNDKITIAATDTTYSAAGTSLGLVQSGGDVTIKSGVITVNDDSHNHIIANVDGLQASIDSKVDKVTGKGLSTNDLTNVLKANYDTAYTHSQQAHAPADAEKNVIVGVQKNGADLTVNSSTRKVNITVPTKTSELTNDSSFVTTIDLDAKADAPFKPEGKSYLTFSSPNSFTLKVDDTTKHWDGTLEYFAEDKTWTVWDGTTMLSAVDNDGEYVLYLRGTGNPKITGNSSNYKWVLTGGDIKCIGNIENLLDYATVESGNHPTMANYCYAYMFRDCTSLTQAPALPATTLANYCYAYMFRDCTSLTQAPALPATTLASYCYSAMFWGCTSLTQAPALPATTLASYCYDHMFNGCTSLTQAPALPATTLASYCYSRMFYGCTSLKLSSTQTREYTQEYRIPSSGTGTTATFALASMFTSTGGTFTETPGINTTYYLSSDNIVVRETEIATLNGYVGSMIRSAYTYGTEDLVAGTSELATGTLYFVYE